jgi:uncharacterized membrane protein YedE/YeeE
MSNPLTMKSWSPYVVGVGIGVLSWFAFASANRHLAITLQFEHVAALTERAAMPDAARQNPYYAVRAAEGKSPKVSWELMLLVGVFLGGMLSSSLSGDRATTTIPRLWQWRFGGSSSKRFVFAFLGGAVMIFGARLAGGCTSGHGISGTLQLAVSSWTFITLAFATAISAAFLMYGTEGRHYV